MDNIKAVLFDSGRVLNRPASGHWFISPGFFLHVDKAKYVSIPKKDREAAFKRAGEYLDSHRLISTRADEFALFKGYYRVFADHLPGLGLAEEQIAALAEDLVYNADKYIFYDDALKIIPQLRKQYKLAVVSDAWPSLEDVYKSKGLYDDFDAFVISSLLGTAKPDPKMYTDALEKLGVAPGEAVFIDDNPANCEGAVKLGIHAILLCRNKVRCLLRKIQPIGKKWEVISDLTQLKHTRLLRNSKNEYM